jgi:VWFA-related protein
LKANSIFSFTFFIFLEQIEVMKLKTFILIALLAVTAFAQTPTSTTTPTPLPVPEDDEVIKVESRLVTVPVAVLDAKGQPIFGLTKDDFTIIEENKPQEIDTISDAEEIPLEIALLVDISASTDSLFKLELETASAFLRNVMKGEDRATIYTIGENPMLIQPRDTVEKSAESLLSIQPTKQFTAFFDTVSSSSLYLKKNAPVKSRKVVVVISDGEDTYSLQTKNMFAAFYKKLGEKINTLSGKELRQMLVSVSEKANVDERNRVLQILQNSDTVFYSINPAGASFQLNKVSRYGQDTMARFAEETGGTAFLPKFLPTTLKEPSQNVFNAQTNEITLKTIFNQLANELRSQYLLQYYSEGDYANDKYVKLKVSLKKGNQTRVRSRQGYFVKK